MYKLKKNSFIRMTYKNFGKLLTLISPRLNTVVAFIVIKGKPINLKSPTTFDEKLSWLKLNTYYKNPLISKCADKYKVREYVCSCGLEEILNEMYGVYNSVAEINWQKLPNKFVLKWNNSCGFNILCCDKESLDINNVIRKMKKWGKTKYYLYYSEMQYKYIEPKIICERLLETKANELPEDYKFYCFNGKAKYVMICVGRDIGRPKFYYYDAEWNLARINKDTKNAPENFYIPKPKRLHEMFQYAENLSQPFPFVRIDFYNLDGKVIFGEMTFTPSAGMNYNWLEEMDLMFGSLLKLPIK